MKKLECILLLFGLFFITSCGTETNTPDDPIDEPKTFGIRVVVANVREQQAGESDFELAARLFLSGKFLYDNYPITTFIAANELSGEKDDGAMPWIGPIKFRDKRLYCWPLSSDEKELSIDCLNQPLHSEYITVQKGELGILAHSAFVEHLPLKNSRFVFKYIGPERNGGIQRGFIASRFQFKYFSNNKIMIVSTHLSHAGSDSERLEELEDLVEQIKNLYESGDLTPILAGDLNCATWESMHRDVIYKDFFVATDSTGIDQILVGRPQSFPGNAGIFLPVSSTTLVLTPTDSEGNALSDHSYVGVDLAFDPNNQPDFLSPPETVSGEGCENP